MHRYATAVHAAITGRLPLISGNVQINIPAGSLAEGGEMLTANCSGDSNYLPTTGAVSVMATTAVSASFTVSGTAVTFSTKTRRIRQLGVKAPQPPTHGISRQAVSKSVFERR